MKQIAFLLYALATGGALIYFVSAQAATAGLPPPDHPMAAPPAAPSTPAPTPIPAEEQGQREQRMSLERRATARWDALIRKDFSTAYSYNSPAYRKLYSVDAFRRTFGDKVIWKKITVVGIDFQGEDAATVGIDLSVVYHDSQSGKPLDMKTYIQEPWVRTDGEWWYLMTK